MPSANETTGIGLRNGNGTITSNTLIPLALVVTIIVLVWFFANERAALILNDATNTGQIALLHESIKELRSDLRSQKREIDELRADAVQLAIEIAANKKKAGTQ